MNVLKRASFFTFTSLALAGCLATASACDVFFPTIIIQRWEGAFPQQVELLQYKKHTEFSVFEKRLLNFEVIGRFNEEMKYHYVEIGLDSKNKVSTVPVGSDYRLLIDGNIEYRVFNIVSSGKAYVGCPLKSALVNSCVVNRSSLSFDKSCGVPVAPK